MPTAIAAAPLAAAGDGGEDEHHDHAEDDRPDEPHQGVAEQGKQSPADPLPCLADGDAGAEHRPPHDDRQHAAEQDRRQQCGDRAGEAGGGRTQGRGRRRFLATQHPQFPGRGQRPDLQNQRNDLGDHHHDRRQPQRRLGVGPDVGDRAVEDVGQGQRPQRDDARLECRWRDGGITRRGIAGRRVARIAGRADSPGIRAADTPGIRAAGNPDIQVAGSRASGTPAAAGRPDRTRRRRCSWPPSCRSPPKLTT